MANPEHRTALIVIHGTGGTFADAVGRLHRLLDVPCWWRPGEFLVDRNDAPLVREVLSAEPATPLMDALRRLVLGRLLAACGGNHGPAPYDAGTVERFEAERVAAAFADLGIPMTPGARRRRAVQLERQAARAIGALYPALPEIAARLRAADGTALTEARAREAIREGAAGRVPGGLPAALEELRELQESGGDLDTVASAVLCAHALRARAAADGRPFAYGRDYRFVFVNYHQSLRFLADAAPADLYVADLPLGAFPDFEDHVRFLHAHGVRFRRFDDHHPCLAAQRAALERLRDDGILGAYSLGPPREGIEPPRCGADLVHAALVEGTPADTPGAQALRGLAHAEDFVTDRTELSRALTELIKSGLNKVELGQALLEAVADGDIAGRLEAAGWMDRVRAQRDAFAAHRQRLGENTCLLRFAPPAADAATAPPRPFAVLVALAPRPEPGDIRFTVGQASEFFAKTVPEADYLFYCYGASLLVARRMNAGDTTLDLGALMPVLGTAADGGHAGAAVCRPDANAAYPAALIGRVDAGGLRRLAAYLGARLAQQGYGAPRRENRSAHTPLPARGARRLVVITLAAVTAGLLLVLLHPAFRPAAVRRSNADFLPHLEAAADADAAAAEDAP